MTAFNFVINYVTDVPKAAALYAEVLGLQPVEQSAGWAMFVVPGGPILGLWARSDAKPAPTAQGGASELCFQVADDAAIRSTRDAWAAAGLSIIQEPVELDFGLTFTATDYDGNRLRCMRGNG